FSYLKPDSKNRATEPEAAKLEIYAHVDHWKNDENGSRHVDYFLMAYDRDEAVPVEWAKAKGKVFEKKDVHDGKVHINVTGREIIERYLKGDKLLGYKGLIERDPSFKLDENHEIGFEPIDPREDDKDQRKRWRTYYLEKAVRLTGSAISN